MQKSTAVTVKIATPFFAALIVIALWGSFLFDTDGSAVGLTFMDISPESGFAVIFGLLGDLIWMLGVIIAVIGITALTSLVSDEKAVQAAILRYLTTRDERTPVDELYPRPWWGTPLLVVNCAVSLIGMASGFWFTATAWFVTMIASRAQHDKLRKATYQLEEIALEKGLDGVRALADAATIGLVETALENDDT